MTQPLQLDPELKRWATPRQAEYIDAVILHGGAAAAARVFGIHKSGIARSIKAVEKRAALQGYSPEHHMTRTVPDGFRVKRVSTYFKADEEGRPGQWLIAEPARDQLIANLQTAVEAMCEEIRPLAPVAPPAFCVAELANLYTLTDFHFGMAVAKADGGKADWNMAIAEDTLVAMFENLIARAPAARVAIFNQLGDLFHFDGLLPITPTHGHVLDASARYEELVKVVIRALRRVIAMLLAKHEQVHVIMAEGNHDLASSVWLRQMFSVLYEGEPRISVDTSPIPYYAYRHGKVFLGFHHGHKRKKEGLPLLFAAMFREMFGLTKVGWIHTGHEHHGDEKEYPGFKVIQHPTISAPDSHAMRGGWMSEREASVISYHEAGYQVGRTTVTPEMLQLAS